jgi:hypothetical protein
MLSIIHISALGVVTVFIATLGIGLLECCSQSSLCVVTLGVGLPESCRMAYRRFYWFHLYFKLGAATRGVGFPASCFVAFLGSYAQKMVFCVGVASPDVGALVVGSYVSCRMSSREYIHISLNIIERIIPKHKIFTETRTQDSFRVCDLSSCNLLSETNKFCLGAVILL